MKKEYINPFSLGVMIVFHNYIIFKYYLMPLIFKEYKNMGFLYILIMILFSFILTNILNNKRINNIRTVINKYRIIKIALIIYLLLYSLMIGTIAVRILNISYFYKYNIIPFIISLFLVALYLSKIKVKGIVNVYTIPACLYFIIVIFVNLCNYSIKDMSLLMPLHKIGFNNIKLILISLFLIIDNYIFLILRKDLKKPYNKFKVFICNSIWLLFVLFELVNMIVLSGDKYLIDYELVGFLSYSVAQTFKYIGNLDFIYIYLVVLNSIFRIGFNLGLVEELGNKYISNIWTFIMIIISYLILLNYKIIYKYIDYYLIGLFVLFIPYFIGLFLGDKVEDLQEIDRRT